MQLKCSQTQKRSMWHQGFNRNFTKLREYFLCKKKKKKGLYSTIRLLRVTLAPFWRVSAGCKQRMLFCVSCRFHQKYLNLCSEDEQRSYGFETTWGWVINDIIFIFGWTNPLICLWKQWYIFQDSLMNRKFIWYRNVFIILFDELNTSMPNKSIYFWMVN